MDLPSVLISASLLLLAVAHSVLGEREVLQPLFAEAWSRPAPRWAMQRILRFAWHLTSLAWLGLAAAVLGAALPHVFAAFGLVSAGVVFVMLRGHLAWPLFGLIGVAGLHQADLLGAPILGLAAAAAATVAVAAAGLHVYWAAGGRFGFDLVIPQRDGKPMFRPPAALTLAVALALLGYAALLAGVATGAAPQWTRLLLFGALAVFVLRAVGDGRRVGFTKSDRKSPFAVWDDRLFTPLVVLLAAGTSAALML